MDARTRRGGSGGPSMTSPPSWNDIPVALVELAIQVIGGAVAQVRLGEVTERSRPLLVRDAVTASS